MSYKHFTIDERVSIQFYQNKGYSIREIASEIGRGKSSVADEIKRNSDARGQYIALYAQSYTDKRKKNSKWIVEVNPKLIEYIKGKILNTWSPEQISNRLEIDYPDDLSMRISFKSIYTLIYNGDIKGITKKNLRRKGKKINYGSGEKRVIIKNRVFISERPESINKRKNIGDWETDTVRGSKKATDCLATYADRKTRYYVALKMDNAKAETFNNITVRKFKKRVNNKINSLNNDNGTEFSQHEKLKKRLKTNIYFARPHAPWERPTNENSNGLLREFFPKGINFSKITQKEIDRAINLINNRPRKCLNWYTSKEIFSKESKK